MPERFSWTREQVALKLQGNLQIARIKKLSDRLRTDTGGDLVSAVQVLLQNERLKIARALPEASTLTSKLLAFKVSISLKSHDSYGNDAGQWRENPYDGLVLAVALAVWYGENRVGEYNYPASFGFSSFQADFT